MIKKIIILGLLILSVSNISAEQVTNGCFTTGDFTGWTTSQGDLHRMTVYVTDGFCLSAFCSHYAFLQASASGQNGYISQDINFTNVENLNLDYILSQGTLQVYIDDIINYTDNVHSYPTCKNMYIDVSTITGIKTLKIKFTGGSVAGRVLRVTNIYTYTPTYITLNFKDNCNNLIRKTAGTYYNAGDPAALNFYTSTGSYEIEFEDSDYLELWVDSSFGTLYYNISNPQGDVSYTILNPTISWNNNIFVQDGNTGLPIPDAMVMFGQDCIINPLLYPSRNKFTNSNGTANFIQCELDSFSLGISKTGYQTLFDSSISTSSLDAFNLEQTILIKLYPIGDEENESEYDYTDYNTWIKFKNVNGNYTTSILDTDNYVDLYYYNNNSDGESMTLKFQKYSVETGIINLLSWNIPIDTDGYKRILKSNYTDTSYLYIGCLYNSAINGWDRIKYLNVKNETSEIDLDYQNLTAFTWFVNKNPEGGIDYREDIEIIAYANTTYVGLFNISLELYDNSSFITHINLTWADFISADLKYYYEWNPYYSYTEGDNYTVRMHGYDYYLLDMDYINATNYRKNELTILVKDQLGNNLVNSFIFLDGYGSISTGISHFNTYENLDDGYYRYRASKSGYEPSGWNDVTLSGADNIVTCVLTASNESATSQRLKTDDNELKNLYIMLMSFLLIFILFGGFMYVTK